MHTTGKYDFLEPPLGHVRSTLTGDIFKSFRKLVQFRLN